MTGNKPEKAFEFTKLVEPICRFIEFKPILFCLILVSIHRLYAQSPTQPEFTHQLKLSPVRLIDPLNPGIELSYEPRIFKKYSLQLSAAYLTNLAPDFPFTHFRGYRIGFEGKRLFDTKRKVLKKYLAVELVYNRTNFSSEGWFRPKDTSLDSLKWYDGYSDDYRTRKDMVYLNFKVGFQITKGHFVLDVYGGLGAKYRSVVHFDRLNPYHEMVQPRHPNIYYFSTIEGKYVTVHFPVNVKIGYAF